MAKFHILLSSLLVTAVVLNRTSVEAKFNDTTAFTWGAPSILGNGDDLELVLDKTSGSGIKSNNGYLFGSIEMLIKLVPGNSAGTVTAYYLSSTGASHDEIDFEFLGNVSGQPYTLHTNIYALGKGNREQQFRFWFDPTTAFHNYTIHWNPNESCRNLYGFLNMWYVDSIPIRVFRHYETQGVPFPNKHGMRMYANLWNADDWATQGGRIKIDWTLAPFKANLRNYSSRACLWYAQTSIAKCTPPIPANWYTAPAYSQLGASMLAQMNSLRSKNMIYDYCKDVPRFNGTMPLECSKPQF